MERLAPQYGHLNGRATYDHLARRTRDASIKGFATTDAWYA